MSRVLKYQKAPPIERVRFECFIQPQFKLMLESMARHGQVSIDDLVERTLNEKFTPHHYGGRMSLCKNCGRANFSKTKTCKYCSKSYKYGTGRISVFNNKKKKKGAE